MVSETARYPLRVKSCSQRFVHRATGVVKQNTKRLSCTVNSCNLNEEINYRTKSIPKRKSLSIGHSSGFQLLLNPYKKFISNYKLLLNSFPEFPKIMMKTLVLREKGNLKAVYKFLVKRGWKSLNKVHFRNHIDLHIQIDHFWGIDKPEYSSILDDKPLGTYFIVLSAPVYYIYFKCLDGIKKQHIPTPDILSLPRCNTINYTKPLIRPKKITLEELIIFSEIKK